MYIYIVLGIINNHLKMIQPVCESMHMAAYLCVCEHTHVRVHVCVSMHMGALFESTHVYMCMCVRACV